jgi:chemotaxis protein MotB
MSHGGGDGGSERWLLSYSDFMTLLMIMFVILYAMGQVDVNKYKQLAGSLKAAFEGGSAAKVVDAQINSGGGTIKDGQPNPIVVPGIPEQPPVSEEVAGQLQQMLQVNNLGSEVSVQTNIEGVLISMSEKLLFTQGKAELQSDAYPVLDTIIDMLKQTDNKIRVVGHTDDTPPQDPKYTSNWDLSLARAMVIANYMMGKGIDAKRLMVEGVGENQPVFPNDTEQHRALNSRADIVVIYNVDSDMVSSSTSHLQ